MKYITTLYFSDYSYYDYSYIIRVPTPHEHIKKLKRENKSVKYIVKSVNRNKRLRLIDKKTRYRG